MNWFFRKEKKCMKLGQVTKLLNELRIPTALVFTPTNLEVEKKKFFESETYEPQFQYRIIRNRNKEIFKELANISEISDVDPRISDFYIDLIQSKRDASDLMYAVGDNDLITEISTDKYGRPSPKLFRNACRALRGKLKGYNLIKEEDIKKGNIYKYDEISKIFDVIFKELDLEGWTVNKSMNIAKNGVKVGVKAKEVLMDPNIERTNFKLKKTIVHEVGTHVLRAHYGLRSGFNALGKANIPDYLDIEEGLATWNEHNLGLLTEKWFKNKAALTWAIYIGEGLSFRQLYNCLLGILQKSDAFDVAYRVKRGLGDTSYPGIYSKDITYFRGFRRVSNRLKENPSLYNQLYAGKITFKQCKWVEEGLIPKPTLVPTKERWLEIFKKAGL